MILMFDKVNFFNKLLRGIFGGIDSLLYDLIAWVLEGIFNLATITASSDLINTIYHRVYVILSLYMVFKLTISFLKYLVNPDSMSDKEQGVGKLVSRTLIMVVLVIAFPLIFFDLEVDVNGTPKKILNALQEGVLNVIPKIVLGVDSADTSSSAESGEALAALMLRNFYFPMECSPNNGDPTLCDTTYSDDGSGSISLDTGNAISSIAEFEYSLTEEGDDGLYKYYYMWPISTVVGIIMVIILLGLAKDVAIRTFKLIGLEMIAPIPIMSYIDPKSSKSDGTFNHWIKSFVSTYISLFANIAVLYFVLLLISKLLTGGLFDRSSAYYTAKGMSKIFILVFLILGLFSFAKEAPKFFKDALAIKDKGGVSNMGKAIAGLGGAAAGFAGGVAAGGLAGGLSGAVSGASMGSQNAGSGKPTKAYSQIRDAQRKAMGRGPGGLTGAAQRHANKKIAKGMGVTTASLEAAKQKMIADQNNVSEVEDLLERFNHGTATADEVGNALGINPQTVQANMSNPANRRVYGSQLAQRISDLQTIASSSKNNYEKADNFAKNMDGVNPNFYDKYASGKFHRAKRVIYNSGNASRAKESDDIIKNAKVNNHKNTWNPNSNGQGRWAGYDPGPNDINIPAGQSGYSDSSRLDI